ncbi:aminoglycoside phosphotransferase family protein [Candidatus Sororendozoicomonas aggregata]|uniref:aminoglycoside phosphotransferase family protein n=1 Tax=Candidatus Sororendozoicomonas aggregata TaxID=3073239 RepID=UPI002ED19F2A
MVNKQKSQALRSSQASERHSQLATWVGQQLAPGAQASLLKPMGNDASFRQYYRVQGVHGEVIAVDAPPETEDTAAFVTIARQWKQEGIKVPEVYSVDLARGFMLLEDFGDCLLGDRLHKGSSDSLYSEAIGVLKNIQQLPADTLPEYNEPLLRLELSLYPEWFLEGLLGLALSATEKQALHRLFDNLVTSALAQPRVTVHRDYHSRNLMLCPDGQLGVIDFQGALHGPLLYDIVSLLKDCYHCWPEEKVNQWFQLFTNGMPELAQVSTTTQKQWFDWLGLQRHLKCLGIFSRLWLRDGRSGYLGELPKTLDYVITACQQYPELKHHAKWLRERVAPVLSASIDRVKKEVSTA